MNHPAIALSWGFWRRGFAILASVVAGALAIPSLLLYLNSTMGTETEVLNGFDVYIFAIVSPFFVCCAFFAVGDPRGSYTLPIATRSLVACSLLNGAIMVVGCVGVTVLFLKLSFGVDFAFWRPSIDGVVALIWCYALAATVTWDPIRSGIVWILATLLAVSHMLFLSPHPADGSTFWDLGASWRTIQATQLIPTILFGIAGIALGLHITHRARRGEPPLTAVWQWMRTLVDRLNWGSPRHSTPRNAELWREWCEKGIALPVMAGVLGVAITGWFLTGLINGSQAVQMIPGFTLILLGSNFLLGGYLGHCGAKFDIPTFKATRPLSDTELADGILINVAKSVVLSWSIWFATMPMALVALNLSGRSIPSHAETIFGTAGLLPAIAPFVGVYLVTAFAGWAVASVGASLYLVRRWLFGAIMLLGICTPIWTAMLAAMVLPRHLVRPVASGIWWGLSTAAVLGVIWVFWYAWRLGLIRARRCGIAATIALVTAGAAVATLEFRFSKPLTTQFLEAPFLIAVLGLAALTPSLALGAAPLAMWWNRHR